MQYNFILDSLQNKLGPLELSAACPQLFNYLLLLNKWNKTYNLTAIRDFAAMIDKHILDSLAIIPWLRGNKILDVGSGAGLPGIPLAIANPQNFFVLLDSNGKKTSFLFEVKRQLDLKNVEIVQVRVENYRPRTDFDTVVSRAFSSIDLMMQQTQHLLASNGLWLAMKGKYPFAELALISQPHFVKRYNIDGIKDERCCILIDKGSYGS